MQNLDGFLDLADYLQTAARVRLEAIPYADETLRNLGTLAFVDLHLLSTGGSHLSGVAELLRLVERLEEIQAEI